METFDKELQYKIFSWDKYKCAYCGSSVPEVHLHAVLGDHNGDVKDPNNYLSLCHKCFLKIVTHKDSEEIDLTNRTKIIQEQTDMMIRWHKELQMNKIKSQEYAIEYFENLSNCSLTDHGRKVIGKLIRLYPFKLVLDSIEASCSQYLIPEEEGYSSESVEKAFNYIEKICNIKTTAKDKPYLKDLFYIRGILKNRFDYVNLHEAIKLLEEAYRNGYSMDSLKKIATDSYSWSQWKKTITALIDK